jgi:WD40 repeat protein
MPISNRNNNSTVSHSQRPVVAIGALVVLVIAIYAAASAGQHSAVIPEVTQSTPIFDCAAPPSDAPLLQVSPSQIFRVGVPEAIVPPKASTNLASPQWSPDDKAILFLAPTPDLHVLPSAGATPGQPYAISRNELWLYNVSEKSWTKIADDAARPRFSMSGKEIFFIGGNTLAEFDIAKGKSLLTKTTLPNTSVALLTTVPLRDGRILSPAGEPQKRASHDVASLNLTTTDWVMPAPDDQHVMVTHRASDDEPSVSVLYGIDGSSISSLRNCVEAMYSLAWSMDGSVLAFPVRDSLTKVYLKSAKGGEPQLVTAFEDRPQVNGISFSPDNRYLALSVGDVRDGIPALWIVSANGTLRQRIGQGSFPVWSTGGGTLLYTGDGASTGSGWYLQSLQ